MAKTCGKKAIYLKINRCEEFAMRNLSRWIDVSYLMDADCYILCDDDFIVEKINDELLLSDMCYFIKSDKGLWSTKIVESIANRNWKNAAYAHLTTFIHAKDNEYTEFWNIDADDTMICLTVDRIKELLENVESRAKANNIDCFSLDMWRTKWKGEHWSFGITYTSACVNWKEIITQYCDDEEYKNIKNAMNYNIDCFFSYLKDNADVRIETFYVENLKFIHYSNDFFKGLISSAFYHWKQGKLMYPIMNVCVGIDEMSEYDIYDDVIGIDIGIKDEEARNILTYYSRDGHEFRGYVEWNEIINKKIYEVKMKKYMQKKDLSGEIICFGVGNCLDNNVEKIKSICDLKYVCDNDSKKWNKHFYGNIICISPEELKHMKNVLVIIMVYSKTVADNIAQQLDAMGIINYDYAEKFLKCVE